MRPVLLDSDVLFPMPLCDTLLHAAASKLFLPCFSQKILSDVTRNLIERRSMSPEKAARREAEIIRYFPEALVEVPESLIEKMSNHPGDRHVTAAAVQAEAKTIVTFNLKHFKESDLSPLGIKAQHPDDFLCDLCEDYGVEHLAAVIESQSRAFRSKPLTPLDILELLEKRGMTKFAEEISTYTQKHHVDRVAREAVSKYGRRSGGEKFLEGDRYKIWLSEKSTLHVQRRGTKIFSSSFSPSSLQRTFEGTLKAEDAKVFHSFGKALHAIQRDKSSSNH